MRYHTTHALSPNIRETPEGYLVCEGVPIARTGVQEYLPEEVPVEPGPSGVILVVRAEEDVFSPETVASFEGKSVTLDHPDPAPDPDDPDVNPDNWRELTCGVAMNVRRGTGKEADLLLADLLVTDAEAIAAVRDKSLRQVSCGYDADYEEVRPGVGRQVNIIGNHIALVAHGRAGGRVGIKDAMPSGRQEGGPGLSRPEGDGCESGATSPGEATSPTGSVRTGRADRPSSQQETAMVKTQAVTKKKAGFWDRFTGHLKKGKTADEAAKAAAQDEDMPERTAQEGEQPATDGGPSRSGGDDIATLSAKVDELTLMLRTLVEGKGTGDNEPDKTDDEEPGGAASAEKTDDEDPTADAEPDDEPGAVKTGDSRRSVRVADAATVRRAVSISPGLAARVGDSTVAVQKLALRKAMRDASLKNMLDGFLRGRTLDALSPAELDAAFCATAEVARHVNNRTTADGLNGVKATTRDFGKPVTPADVNAMNKKFYDKKAG